MVISLSIQQVSIFVFNGSFHQRGKVSLILEDLEKWQNV